MSPRRWLGAFTLFAMMHVILVGSAAACPPPRGDAHAAAHVACAADASHADASHADRGSRNAAQMPQCCDVLASCTLTPLASRGDRLATVASPTTTVASFAQSVPRGDAPAPELPPPRA